MPRYGGQNAYVDDSVFQRQAKRLAKRLKVDEHDFVKAQSGLLARDIARLTPPYQNFPGFGNKSSIGTTADMMAGKEAIRIDVRSIVIVIKDEDVPGIVKKYGKGAIYGKDGVVAPGILQSQQELKKWHKEMSNTRGRVRKVSMPNIPFVGENTFVSYLKQEYKDVGIAKAAMYGASVGLQAKGAALVAIKKHVPKSGGRGFMTKTSEGSTGNISGSADGLFHVIRHLPKLRTDRLKKAVKRLQYIAKAMAKKSGFKTS